MLPHNVSDKELALGVGDQLMHMDFEEKPKSVMTSVYLT